jgi:hypothetical protein
MDSGRDTLAGGFPHSEICGSRLVCQLPAAFRRLPRLSSPVVAKASTVCACSLDPLTPKPVEYKNLGLHFLLYAFVSWFLGAPDFGVPKRHFALSIFLKSNSGLTLRVVPVSASNRYLRALGSGALLFEAFLLHGNGLRYLV